MKRQVDSQSDSQVDSQQDGQRNPAARAGFVAGVADRAEVVGAEPLAARGSMIETIVSKKSFYRNYSDVGHRSASHGA
jgi:hypothetical protein